METVEEVRKFVEANKDKEPFKNRTLNQVTILSGGLVNYVFRLEFDDRTSVIVKYYPRFLSSDKTVEMSQSRYFVEKTALTLLNDQPWTRDNPNSLVRTPKVLLTDDDSFVLVMQDAGKNTKTLLEHLKNNEALIKDETLISQIARDIFDFSNYLSFKSGISWETHSNILENRSALQIIGGYVCRFCEEQSKRLNLQTELEPYLKNLRKSFCAFQDLDEVKKQGLERVLSFGDLWPNSILVDSDSKHLWIIDWEMARFESPKRDIQQLIANLWVMKQNESLFNAKSIDNLIKRLQFEFFGDENKDWRLFSDSNGKSTFVLWVTTLVREKHWQLEDQRTSVLNAIREVEQL